MQDRKGGSKGDKDPDDIPVTRCRVPLDKEGRFTVEQCEAFTPDERQHYGIRPCGFIYEITESCCPECGYKQPLSPRGEPVVDRNGKLVEVSAEELAKMRGGDDLISDQAAVWRQEIQSDLLQLQMTPEKWANSIHTPAAYMQTQITNHRRWRAVHGVLRPLMDEWMDYHSNNNIGKEAAQELFLRRFGTNVYYAQVLKPKEANELIDKIKAHLAEMGAVNGLTYN